MPTMQVSHSQHFTGKERDTESGLDYFGARYYASAMGRFLSPDWSAKEEPVPYAKLDNPQTLNLYSYVQNNPLSRIDADGHEVDFDQNAKKGVKLELKNVSRAERKIFQTTKHADGKSVLSLKPGAEANFHGNHTEGFQGITTTG
jgi:RHS repeat-associated protein